MNMKNKIIFSFIGFIIIILLGIWLSNSGRPFNPLIFNIHKLLAITLVIFNYFIIKNLKKFILFSKSNKVMLLISFLAFLVLIITGGLLSLEEPIKGVVLFLHSTLPAVVFISYSVLVYDLYKRMNNK